MKKLFVGTPGSRATDPLQYLSYEARLEKMMSVDVELNLTQEALTKFKSSLRGGSVALAIEANDGTFIDADFCFTFERDDCDSSHLKLKMEASLRLPVFSGIL